MNVFSKLSIFFTLTFYLSFSQSSVPFLFQPSDPTSRTLESGVNSLVLHPDFLSTDFSTIQAFYRADFPELGLLNLHFTERSVSSLPFSYLKGDIIDAQKSNRGYVTVSRFESSVSIKFSIDNSNYFLVPSPLGGYRLLIKPMISDDVLMDCLPVVDKVSDSLSFEFSNSKVSKKPAINSSSSSSSSIRVLIVHTSLAKEWALSEFGDNGIEHVVNWAMASAQHVLDNSEVSINLELAGVEEVDFDESIYNSYYILSVLTDFSASFSGLLDEVHYYRRMYNADLVSMFAFINDVGGIAWLPSIPDSQLGFSITRVQQASNSFTHIHELGHNFGSDHSRLQDSNASGFSGGRTPYSTGWRFTGESGDVHTTVMSYPNYKGVSSFQIPYFSNPNVVYDDRPVGTMRDLPGGPSNNARSISEVRHLVEQYMDDIEHRVPFLNIPSTGFDLSKEYLILLDSIPSHLDFSVRNRGNSTLHLSPSFGSNFSDTLPLNTSISIENVELDQFDGLDFQLKFIVPQERKVIESISILLSDKLDLSGRVIQIGGHHFDPQFHFIPWEDIQVDFVGDSLKGFASILGVYEDWIPRSILINSTDEMDVEYVNSDFVFYGSSYDYSKQFQLLDSSYNIEPGESMSIRIGVDQAIDTAQIIETELILLSNDFYRPRVKIPVKFRIDEPSPDTIVIVSPAENAVLNPDQLFVTWQADPYSNSYGIELMNSRSIIFNDIITDTIIQFSNLRPKESYLFKIIGLNNSGQSSTPSIRRFTTSDYLPDVVDLTFPLNNNILDKATVRFDWEPADRATSYLIQVKSTTNDSLYVEKQVTRTSAEIELDFNYDYNWRVLGINNGLRGPWSETRTFSIQSPPIDLPILFAPQNREVLFVKNSLNQLRFDWSRPESSNKHRFQMYSDQDNSIVLDTLVSTSFLSIEVPIGNFNWRVKSLNNYSESEWSDKHFFEVRYEQLGTPELLSPIDNNLISENEIVFDWKRVQDATYYLLEVENQRSFELSTDTIYNSHYRKLLDFGSKYSWRVKAFNNNRESYFSNSNRFEIVSLQIDPRKFIFEKIDPNCAETSKGSVVIEALDRSYSYAVYLNDNLLSFLNTSNDYKLIIENLESGTHEICIRIPNQESFSKCYSVEIRKPEIIQASIKRQFSDQVELLLSGSSNYKMFVNGKMYAHAGESQFTFELAPGKNIVNVQGAVPCQGSVSFTFHNFLDTRVYPNPAKNILNVYYGGTELSTINWRIYNLSGALVRFGKSNVNSSVIAIDVDGLVNGIYFLHLLDNSSPVIIKFTKI